MLLDASWVLGDIAVVHEDVLGNAVCELVSSTGPVNPAQIDANALLCIGTKRLAQLSLRG